MAQNQVSLCLVQSLPCTSNKFTLFFSSWEKLLWTFCFCLKKQEPIFHFPGYYHMKLKPLRNLISFEVIPKKNTVQHFSAMVFHQLIEQNSVIHTHSEKEKLSSLKVIDFFYPLKYYNYWAYFFPWNFNDRLLNKTKSSPQKPEVTSRKMVTNSLIFLFLV